MTDVVAIEEGKAVGGRAVSAETPVVTVSGEPVALVKHKKSKNAPRAVAEDESGYWDAEGYYYQYVDDDKGDKSAVKKKKVKKSSSSASSEGNHKSSKKEKRQPAKGASHDWLVTRGSSAFVFDGKSEESPLLPTTTKDLEPKKSKWSFWPSSNRSAFTEKERALSDSSFSDSDAELYDGKATHRRCHWTMVVFPLLLVGFQCTVYGYYLYLYYSDISKAAQFVNQWAFSTFTMREGQVWRIWSSVFVHTDAFHFLLNTVTLCLLSLRLFTSFRKSLAVLLAYALCSTFACLLNGYHPCEFCFGAGGATTGLTAYYLTEAAMSHKLSRSKPIAIGVVTLLVCVVGFEPHLMGAVGGVTAGFVLAVFVIYKKRRHTHGAKRILFLAMVLALILIGVSLYFALWHEKDVTACRLTQVAPKLPISERIEAVRDAVAEMPATVQSGLENAEAAAIPESLAAVLPDDLTHSM